LRLKNLPGPVTRVKKKKKKLAKGGRLVLDAHVVIPAGKAQGQAFYGGKGYG